jgi:hypothetical protein
MTCKESLLVMLKNLKQRKFFIFYVKINDNLKIVLLFFIFLGYYSFFFLCADILSKLIFWFLYKTICNNAIYNDN